MDHSLYSYTNYRDFLKEYVSDAKKKLPSLSYRWLSKKAGFLAPTYMRMVVLGQRNLSEDGIQKLGHCINLNKIEANFFKYLVHFNQATNPQDKKFYFEKLCFFKAFYEIKKIDHKNYVYFSKWYYPTIREMTLLHDFKEDPHWIAKKLGGTITPDKASLALTFLVEIGMLKRNANQQLKPVDEALISDPEIKNLSLRNFHQEMINQSLKALEQTPSELRDIASITIVLDQPTMVKTKKMLQEFRKELVVMMSQSKNPDSVYQINFQMFPLTTPPQNKEKGYLENENGEEPATHGTIAENPTGNL